MTSPVPPRPDRPSALVLAGASLTLVAWNTALNLVPFPASSYVPANLALAGSAVLIGRRAGLTRAEVGLGGPQWRGLAAGLGAAAAIGAGLLVALRVPSAAPLLADERAAGLSGMALAYGAAIRIPLGTAVPEEVVFRGVLLAAFGRRFSWWRAATWSSAVFGLWHIGPTIVLAGANGLDGSAGRLPILVTGAVAGTTLAGLGFCLLRRWGGGVVAPALVHAATNALSLLAAAAAQRVS